MPKHEDEVAFAKAPYAPAGSKFFLVVYDEPAGQHVCAWPTMESATKHAIALIQRRVAKDLFPVTEENFEAALTMMSSLSNDKYALSVAEIRIHLEEEDHG